MAEKSGKSLAKNSFYYLLYNVLNMLFPVLSGMYVARVLLAEDIGKVTYAGNIVQYFVILAFLGIPTYGLREISKVKNSQRDIDKVYSELFTINLISTICFLLLYCVLVFSFKEFRENLLIYIIMGSLIALNALNISWLYEGLEEFKFISLRNIVIKGLIFLLLLVFVRDSNDYYWYAIITVFGTAGNYFINIFYAPRFAKLSFNNLNLKRHIKPVMFLVMVNLAIEIYSLIDITMIGFICDKSNVAYYSYGHRIQKILLQIINTFTVVVVPRLSFSFKERNFSNFNQLISKTLNIIFLLGVPLVIGTWFTSKDIIRFLYGDSFIRSAYVLSVLTLLLVISPVGYLLGSRVLLVTNNENKMVLCVTIGAVVNVICNWFLIQYFNEFGAAIASVISEFVVMIVYISQGKRYFKLVGISMNVLKEVIASIFMAVLLFFTTKIELPLFMKIPFEVFSAIVVYFGILCVVRDTIVYDNYKMIIKKLRVR